jgi:spermidine/putrescine transport system ATP-binding protein
MSDCLVIESVTKSFAHADAPVLAVDDLSLNIRENEFFTLLGPSGCGKTTLLRLIAGLESTSTGRILLSGDDITHLPPNRRPVNTVFQNYALFPHMTVAENIGFGLKMLGRPADEISTAVTDALKTIRLEQLGSRKPGELSGGQQQRVALARALVNRPRVLLLDESLSALDYKLRKDMQIELKRLQRETGVTFVFVTHDQDEALSMSDRIAVMHKGRIAQLGTPQEIYHHPTNRFVADFIGICNFVNGGIFGLSDAHDVGFRPEDAQLNNSKHNDGDLQAHGRLTHITYHGATTRFQVTLNSGEQVILAPHTPPALAVDSEVTFSVPADRLIRCSV